MAHCEFMDSCSFLSDRIIDMPIATCNLVETLCNKGFDVCAIHTIALTQGINNVPKSILPQEKQMITDKVTELVLWGRLGW